MEFFCLFLPCFKKNETFFVCRASFIVEFLKLFFKQGKSIHYQSARKFISSLKSLKSFTRYIILIISRKECIYNMNIKLWQLLLKL